MNHEPTPPRDDAPLPDALRWQLRALRQDTPPASDLWPGIAGRLAVPTPSALPPRRRWPGMAIAASLVVAIGAIGLLGSRLEPARLDTTALREAEAIEAEYREALRSIGRAPAADPIAPAVAELDRSTRQIRRALDRDPDSRLLLEQLRRTYALRLALSQRALAG